MTTRTTYPREPVDRLLAASGAVAAISFVAGVAASVGLADDPYPRPGVDVETAQRFFRGNRLPARLGVAGQLVSAAALVGLTAQVLRRAGGSATMRKTAVAGGALAGATLAVSAVASAALTGPAGDDKNMVRVLHQVVFLAGGPAHNVGLGLLIGAGSVAGRQSGTLPRGLVNGGLGAGTAACLSPISLVSTPAMVAIPLGRLSCLVVGALAGRRLASASLGGDVSRG